MFYTWFIWIFQDEPADKGSSSESDSSSDDDDRQWTKELKRQHHLLRQEAREREEAEEMEMDDTQAPAQPKFYELKEGEELKSLHRNVVKRMNK